MSDQEMINELVLEHHKILPRIEARLENIDKCVNNGLSAELQSTVAALAKFKEDCKAQCALREIAESKNWFLKMLQAGATKVVGILIIFGLFTAVTTVIGYSVMRTYGWQEKPGQLASIVTQGQKLEQQGVEFQLHAYHFHICKDGKRIFHAGDPNIRAYVENPLTGKLEPAPQFRTEDSVK